MENVEKIYQKRINTDERAIKPSQREMQLDKFFERHILSVVDDTDLREQAPQDDFEASSLRYSYMRIARYPAFGSWHFLLKQYVLRGIGEEEGLTDVYEPKMVKTKWKKLIPVRQGTAKVIYLSYALLAVWYHLKDVKMPLKSVFRSRPDGEGDWLASWYHQESDFKNAKQK